MAHLSSAQIHRFQHCFHNRQWKTFTLLKWRHVPPPNGGLESDGLWRGVGCPLLNPREEHMMKHMVYTQLPTIGLV